MLPSMRKVVHLSLFLGTCFIPSLGFAGDKSSPPIVPGFVRFYAAEKADQVKAGHLLLGELHCTRCHAPAAASALDKEYKPGPILDSIGARVKRSHLREFLGDPHKTKPGTIMPNLFAGIDAQEKKDKVESLVHYLASDGVPIPIRPDRKGINLGRDLYQKVGCVACHGTRDAKGDQDKLFATSIPLGRLKDKYHLASLKAFLENPHGTRPTGKMPGILNSKEAGDVANYLLQGAVPGMSATNMKFAYYEGSWQKLPDFTKIKPVFSGEAADFELTVVRRLNDCALKFEGFLRIEADGNYTFHTHSDDGSKLWIGDQLVVNNDGIHAPASKSGKIKLSKGTHKVIVAVFNGGGGFELGVEFEGPGTPRQTLGPRIMLTEEPVKEQPIAKGDVDNEPLQPALAAKGKELFASMGCANCHQKSDQKSRIEATAEATLKAEGGCLSATPTKGLPWYGVSAQQGAALKAALSKGRPAAVSDHAEIVKSTMVRFNCYACHERDKFGGVQDDVNKQFLTVMPEMGDEGRIPPSLTGVGAKLKPAYLKKILNEGSHDRPYMHTRMPKFGDSNIGHLVGMYASLDKAEAAPKVTLPEPSNKAKFAGRTMVGPKAFDCTKCHTFAGNKAEGVQGIDLAIMTQRLNHDWFYNFMLDPSKYRPGTRMPGPFINGKTPLKNLLDGQTDAQIEALWFYLSDGTAATLPVGLAKQSIPLTPTDEAIIYRNFIKGAGNRAIGVGFPERAHIAFDANELRLAMIWQGAFIDAKRHWTGRGEGFEPPLGDNILNLPAGVSFFALAKPDDAWPTKVAKDLGYKFRGYRLTDDQRPTFLYSLDEIQIEDTPNAFDVKGNPALRRTFTLMMEKPVANLYYRAAVGDKIDVDKDGAYRVNTWQTRIEAEARPVIRQSGAKMELLVPVRFKGNMAKIVQEYVW